MGQALAAFFCCLKKECREWPISHLPNPKSHYPNMQNPTEPKVEVKKRPATLLFSVGAALEFPTDGTAIPCADGAEIVARAASTYRNLIESGSIVLHTVTARDCARETRGLLMSTVYAEALFRHGVSQDAIQIALAPEFGPLGECLAVAGTVLRSILGRSDISSVNLHVVDMQCRLPRSVELMRLCLARFEPAAQSRIMCSGLPTQTPSPLPRRLRELMLRKFILPHRRRTLQAVVDGHWRELQRQQPYSYQRVFKHS